jgi:hypothetical protein
MKMTQFERSENSNIHLLIHSLDERYKKELQFLQIQRMKYLNLRRITKIMMKNYKIYLN